MSILEISHRSKTFDKIIAGAKDNLKKLLDINDDYELIIFTGRCKSSILYGSFELYESQK